MYIGECPESSAFKWKTAKIMNRSIIVSDVIFNGYIAANRPLKAQQIPTVRHVPYDNPSDFFLRWLLSKSSLPQSTGKSYHSYSFRYSDSQSTTFSFFIWRICNRELTTTKCTTFANPFRQSTEEEGRYYWYVRVTSHTCRSCLY